MAFGACSRVTRIRVPEHPSGWPSAIAAMHIDLGRIEAELANASSDWAASLLSSTRSRSSTVRPARFRAF